MNQTPDLYLHGHDESVLRSHTWRTIDNSAPHLIPRLESGQRILDVGCGPGTITRDLAQWVAPGGVLGIDAVDGVLDEARALLEAPDAPANCRFQRGDVYALDFDDESFDVVHAHQVLQHLTDPVAALIEMRRVLAPGGVLAVRDADYGAMSWAPADTDLTRWADLYHRIADQLHVDADAGRHLLGWVQAAGFTDIEPSSSTWTFATAETRSWWGGLWADRVHQSSFATHALEYGLADAAGLDSMAAAWRRWADRPDGWFMCPHGEIIAHR